MKIAPKTALKKGGEGILIPVEEVRAGDIFIVKPGESVPVDGEIPEGETAVDESALTGESGAGGQEARRPRAPPP